MQKLDMTRDKYLALTRMLTDPLLLDGDQVITVICDTEIKFNEYVELFAHSIKRYEAFSTSQRPMASNGRVYYYTCGDSIVRVIRMASPRADIVNEIRGMCHAAVVLDLDYEYSEQYQEIGDYLAVSGCKHFVTNYGVESRNV